MFNTIEIMWRQHSDIALTILLRLAMSKGLSDIALKIAIEIIYVEAAFRYCTHSTFEIIHVKTIFSYCTCRCYQDNLCPDSIQLLHFQSYGVINDKFSACSFEEGHMLDKAPYVF